MTKEYKTEAVECGDIYAPSAKKFSAPQLRKSWEIWANNAKRIEL